MKTVVEFTMHVKPGHYDEVKAAYSKFAGDFLASHSALRSVLVVGDPASGTVRGIGVFDNPKHAEAVNSDPIFAKFNDRIAHLITGSPERTELQLLHSFQRGQKA
jgi:quinol monooxygenase YgiN